MDYRVQFLKDTANAIIPADYNSEDTLIIYRDGYKVPKIAKATTIEFEDYRKKYSEIYPTKMIIVGLNRIIKPSNRCDFVFEYLQTTTPHIPKISIDSQPFLGEPWRVWFHYSVANCGNWGANYSYPFETEWTHWFYRENESCKFDSNKVGQYIKNTYSDLDTLDTKFILKPISEVDESWYSDIANNIIEENNTPKTFINTILKSCNTKFNLDISFDSYRSRGSIEMPDLGIYRFVKEENLRRLSIYNMFCKL